MWHGMMCSSSASLFLTKDSSATTTTTSNDIHHESFIGDDKITKFDSRVFVNRNVTYYGMIGAIFEPYSESDDGSDRVDKNINYNVPKEDK